MKAAMARRAAMVPIRALERPHAGGYFDDTGQKFLGGQLIHAEGSQYEGERAAPQPG